jgi:hypothetical protein
MSRRIRRTPPDGETVAAQRRHQLLGGFVLIAATVVFLAAVPVTAFAAPVGGRSFVISVGNLSPLVALIAGILILVMPRLLNYIVAIYLIIVGLIGIGLFGRG